MSLCPTGHREEERPAVSVFAWEEVGADEIPSAVVYRGCGCLGKQLPPGEEVRRKSLLAVGAREEQIADLFVRVWEEDDPDEILDQRKPLRATVLI